MESGNTLEAKQRLETALAGKQSFQGREEAEELLNKILE